MPQPPHMHLLLLLWTCSSKEFAGCRDEEGIRETIADAYRIAAIGATRKEQEKKVDGREPRRHGSFVVFVVVVVVGLGSSRQGNQFEMGGGLARGLCLPRFSVECIRRRSSQTLVSSPFLSLLPFIHSSHVSDALGLFNLGRSSRARVWRVVCSDSNAGSDPFMPAVQSAAKIKFSGPKMSFCPSCGGPIAQRIPEGEHELRAVCTICGSIHYQNPKMVVGCLVEHDNKVLLCRRSIQPSYGLWTLPAGYMELGESAAEGAARETWEEAQAKVEIVAHFAHLDIPVIGQSYIIFRARLKEPSFSPGPESLECALFALDEIPFDSIAFSSVSVALKMYVDDIRAGHFRQHHGVIDRRPSASPSDPEGYVVRNHLCV